MTRLTPVNPCITAGDIYFMYAKTVTQGTLMLVTTLKEVGNDASDLRKVNLQHTRPRFIYCKCCFEHMS